MTRFVLVTVALFLQSIFAARLPRSGTSAHEAALPPYPTPLKMPHKKNRRDAPINYDRFCNSTGYGAYACITCNDPIIMDPTQMADVMWLAADGDNAWTNAKHWWIVLQASGEDHPLGAIQGFVESISYYWQGPGQWHCGDIGETNCNHVVTCSQANIPAASLALTAFANIHMFFNNLYTGIIDAGSSMSYQLSGFSHTFAPQGPDTLKTLKEIIDLFIITYGLVGAGVWNKILKDAPIFKAHSNDHGWAKDASNSYVSGSMTLAKDAQPGQASPIQRRLSKANRSSVQGELDTQNDMASALGTIIDGWANVTAAYLSELFSGSETGLAQLDNWILGGNWSDPEFINSVPSLLPIMENVLYASLIPQAWLDHDIVNPVVVYQEGTNITNPLTPIIGIDAADPYNGLSDEEDLSVRTEYNNYTLWLLDAHSCESTNDNPRFGTGTCDSPVVKLLSGSDELIPGNPWGNVLIDDINISAFTGFQLNGMKNGYKMPEQSMYTDFNKTADYPFQAGIRTPGFFSVIPVCTMQTVYHAAITMRGSLEKSARCSTYPCCP